MAIPPWSELTVEEKRSRTLAAADTLFARDGLDVAMPVLAAAVGAGVGSIYRQVGPRRT
jgi:AcrR family transcriptional regulator